MTKEALKLALEALEMFCEYGAILKPIETRDAIKEALVQPEQEPVAWKPDRSGKYLTVVYRDVIPGDEVGAIVDHPKCVIMSWSNAVHDVEQLKNTTPPQRTAAEGEDTKAWVGLTDEERFEVADHSDCFEDVVDAVEAKLKEKNT